MSRFQVVSSRKAKVQTDNGNIFFHRRNDGSTSIEFRRDNGEFQKTWDFPNTPEGLEMLNQISMTRLSGDAYDQAKRMGRLALGERDGYTVFYYPESTHWLTGVNYHHDEERVRDDIGKGLGWLYSWAQNELTAPANREASNLRHENEVLKERIEELEKQVKSLTTIEYRDRDSDTVLSWTSGTADDIIARDSILSLISILKEKRNASVKDIAEGFFLRGLLMEQMSEAAYDFVKEILTKEEMDYYVERIENGGKYIAHTEYPRIRRLYQ